MKSEQLPSKPACTKCHKHLDGVSDLEGDSSPSVGDITICFYCSALLVFEDSAAGLTLRDPTPAENRALLANTRLQESVRRIRIAINLVKASQPRKI